MMRRDTDRIWTIMMGVFMTHISMKALLGALALSGFVDYLCVGAAIFMLTICVLVLWFEFTYFLNLLSKKVVDK